MNHQASDGSGGFQLLERCFGLCDGGKLCIFLIGVSLGQSLQVSFLRF